jgi:hypothetical protein
MPISTGSVNVCATLDELQTAIKDAGSKLVRKNTKRPLLLHVTDFDTVTPLLFCFCLYHVGGRGLLCNLVSAVIEYLQDL